MSLLARERNPPSSVAQHILWCEPTLGSVALTDWLPHPHTHPPPPPLLLLTPQRSTTTLHNTSHHPTSYHIIPHPHTTTTTPPHHHTTTPPHHQNKQNMSETVKSQLVGKNITFAVVGQITHMNHQNNQEEKYHLLCDGWCPHQIRLFTTGGFRRPHQFFFFFFFTSSVFLKLLREDKMISAGPE